MTYDKSFVSTSTNASLSFDIQQQYHSKIDDLIDNAVKEIISLLVSKVMYYLFTFLSQTQKSFCWEFLEKSVSCF